MTPLLAVLWLSSPWFRDTQRTPCQSLADSAIAVLESRRDLIAALTPDLSSRCRNDFAALFRVGRAINRAARFEQMDGDLPLREAAARLLNRAVQLRRHNAAAWFEYGLAIKKRGGLQIDAYRAIERALDLAEKLPDSTPPRLLAEIQFQRARHMQDWVDRFRWLKVLSGIGVLTPACSNLGPFCENYTRPMAFNEQLRNARPLDVDVREQRDRLIELYEQILRLDPAHREAAERLGRELALGEEWELLADLGRTLQNPVLEALGVYRLGRYRLADALFSVAVPQLADSVRRWYEHPPKGLDTIADFWRRSRPLWLASVDETRLEYRARLTYAFLVFKDREAEVGGPETPQGDALIRYGWPTMLSQLERGTGVLLSRNQVADVIGAALDCAGGTGVGAGNGGLPECGRFEPGFTKDIGGGRWLLWTYTMDQPSLVFEQRPGMRVPRYVFDGAAEEHAKVLREQSPLTFASNIAPRSHRLPVQAARFRDESPGRTTLALFGLVPAKRMALPPADSVGVGLFVFRDTTGFPLLLEQRGDYLPGEALALAYRVPLAPGRYAYSLEAFAPARGVAGTARESLTAPVWAADSLMLSDLLIAHRVESATGDVPVTWRDLTIEPSRTLEVAKGASLWAVWETYGLQAGPQGTGRYQVTLALRDVNAQSAPLRLLERLGVGRRHGTPAVALEWAAERRLSPDGRALEYVAVELPTDIEGKYELVVTVTDPATGRTAKSSRTITIAQPS